MKYAEVIFETGAKSVVSYESEDELKAFLSEHHRRATTGEFGSAQDYVPRTDIEPELATQADRVASRPAERIHKVLLYSDHPIDLYNDKVDADKAKTLIDGMAVGGEFSHEQLIQAIRDEASPIYPQDQGRLVSMFKAQEDDELDLAFLDASGGTSE